MPSRNNPKEYQFDLDPTVRPAGAPIVEHWYPGIQPYALQASSKRDGDPITDIRTIVIHATAGSSSAGAVSVIRDGKASFHWLVPDEDEDEHGKLVWATCHEARAAWHVRNAASHPDVDGGAGRINHRSLGIEVVNSQKSGDAFSDWQVRATADIVRHCWVKYPNLVHVVSHAKLDPSRRDDPGANFPWDTFKAYVLGGTDGVGIGVARPLVVAAVDASEIGSPETAGCCAGDPADFA